MDRRKNSFRFDLIQEVIKVDEKTRIVTFSLKPDPKRYEWITKDGEEYIFDKYDNTLMPKHVYFDSMKQLKNQPLYYQPPKIRNSFEYYRERKPLIEEIMKSRIIEFTPEDKSEDFLESLSTNRLNFVILSLDTVGSTKLSNTMDPEEYAFMTSLISYELSNIVPLFNGFILKYTGDGIIAYFPEPSFITKNDLAIDCALTLRGLIYHLLNPIFESNNLPSIDIRIGLDAGEAFVQTIGNPSAKQHKDIIGAVISIAAKIQSKAEPKGIYMGETVERNLHVNWRENCIEIADIENWPYKNIDGNLYRIFKYNRDV